MANFVTQSGGHFQWKGSRFRFIGGNMYAIFYRTTPYTSTELDTFFQGCINDGISVVRTWIYNNYQPADNNPGIFAYLSGGAIVYREASFVQADLILDRARAAGVKLTLVFTDWKSNQINGGNPIVDYLRWNDSINGTSYIAGYSKSVSSYSVTSNIGTITTTTPHGFFVGEGIVISGASFGTTTAQFPAVVISVPTSTTFTFSMTHADGSATGTITAALPANYTQSFYVDPNIQTLFKNYMAHWVNRVNTINGLTYKNDDTIFAWELGNEMRFDQNDDPFINGSSSINLAVLGGSGGWIDIMSTYLKSIDTNHMVFSTDLAHTTDYVTNDTIHNGTYYGVDFTTTASLTHIDSFDCHLYPYQGDNTNLQGYGYALSGYGGGMAGLRAQVDKFIQIAHANGKPMIFGESGVIKATDSNNLYVNYPRAAYFKKIIDDFFASDGDGFIVWHYYGQFGPSSDNNYGIQSAGEYPTASPFDGVPGLNGTDMPLINFFRAKNQQLQGKRVLLSSISSGLP